ncbi:MAG: bifunctional riboflavin kinase/FAD synthetase [Lautropia sp.]|nr:bifunctional riboflavin kinase/FAD synthetase [Lautropia sp.]
MKIFRSPLPPALRQPCALTIGNFDGVHLGHQALLRRVVDDARRLGVPATVLTFEPHPREYFTRLAEARGQSPGAHPVRIATLRDRLGMLARLGIEQVCLARFNESMAQWPADDFVRDFLADGLRARHIRIGTDFRFGARRRGDFTSLRTLGRRHGIEVDPMPTVEEAGVRISSSLVRDALTMADFAWTEKMLGRPFALSGRVTHGRKLGNRLGFPTLNLRLSHGRPALQGVFIVQVHGLSDRPLAGVANLGTRPAVESHGSYLLETHLLDWRGNAYGRLIRVQFLHKLRDELHFPELESLARQIAADTEAARAYFQTNTPR